MYSSKKFDRTLKLIGVGAALIAGVIAGVVFFLVGLLEIPILLPVAGALVLGVSSLLLKFDRGTSWSFTAAGAIGGVAAAIASIWASVLISAIVGVVVTGLIPILVALDFLSDNTYRK